MMYSRKNFLDSMNMTSNNMFLFHEYCITLIISILFSVCLLFYIIIPFYSKMFKRFMYNANMTESIWTILPMFFLISLSSPSFYMLYVLESEKKYDLTLKTISHQWYWSYESSDLISFYFDSYMSSSNELNKSSNRLLEVDNSLLMPYNSNVRLCVTSSDVLHSWAIPNMALKADATPSRLNILNIKSNNPSSIYSQCSEICSVNHSFMPIHIEFMSWKDMLKCYMLYL